MGSAEVPDGTGKSPLAFRLAPGIIGAGFRVWHLERFRSRTAET